MSAGPRVVLISDVLRLHPDAAGLFGAAGLDPVERYDLASSATPEQLHGALRDSWAVVAGTEHYGRPLLARLPALRAIARPGVGVDSIDVEAATEVGVAVLITPGANDTSVADHAIALMLAVLRRLGEHDAAVRDGRWRAAPVGRELSGLRVGIVGLGSIGRAVARRLSGFGCALATTEPHPDAVFCEQYGIDVLDLPDLAARSDVLSVHAPLLPRTAGMIDADILTRMPAGSILINTSRGPIVDQGALLDSLRRGHLAGAGIDVFQDEPVGVGHPLAAFQNVVLTPHIGAFSTQAIVRMAEMTVASLASLMRGVAPPTMINLPALPGVAR